MNTTLLNIALSQYGIKEIPGMQDNPEVLKYFNDIGFDGAKLKDETAWCSALINWCAFKANLKRSGKLTARSWVNIGLEVETPELGDVVVLWRESRLSWKGHVGIFIRKTENWVYMLGGNQSNQVNISKYPINRVLTYRRL